MRKTPKKLWHKWWHKLAQMAQIKCAEMLQLHQNVTRNLRMFTENKQTFEKMAQMKMRNVPQCAAFVPLKKPVQTAKIIKWHNGTNEIKPYTQTQNEGRQGINNIYI